MHPDHHSQHSAGGRESMATQAFRKPEKTEYYTKGEMSDILDGHIEWKHHMEGVKAELLGDLSCHVKTLLDKAVSEAVQSYTKENKTPGLNEKPRGPVKERKKVFRPRASLLDELMEVEHFRTIFHIFVAILCIFMMSKIAVDSIDQGRLVLQFDLLFYTFGQPETVIWSWICMFTYTLLVPYKMLSFWGSLYPKSKHKLLLSGCMGTLLLVCHTCVLFVFPVYVVKHYSLPPASSFIVILEQIRFIMKNYAFLRETIPLVLQDGSKENKAQIPALSKYLYFLFCPTMIYRDNYPRTAYIRWKFVAKNFAEFFGCILFDNYIMETLCFPALKNMSKQPFSAKSQVISIFHATLPGSLLLLISFYALLHCWLNAFAEMLRFADRMFYKDWWNSTSFSNYYRTWNVVIHDWLYYYIYQDLQWLFKNRFRTGGMLTAFLLSAVTHEYGFILCYGYFYPVMFILFTIFGVLFNFVLNDKRTSPVWNVIMWTSLFTGQGIQVSLYMQEWYAQIHCPLTEKTFWDLVTPRSWSCYP